MKGQLADRISMGLYTIGSLSLCFQAIYLSTRISSSNPRNYNTIVYFGQAILLAALATFLNRAYGLHLAMVKFINLALDGDMLDIGGHYGGRSLTFNDSNDRKKNGFWVAELREKNGSSLIVGGTGIGRSTSR